MRIKINDKIYRLEEIESGVDSLMELVEEPKYKDGDFLHSDWESENITIICKKINGNHLYYHAGKSNSTGLGFNKYGYWPDNGDFRLATESEKKELIDALAEIGKRWNAEKKCVEDIPKRKFKKGDKVRIKKGISSGDESMKNGGPLIFFVELMDKYIGKELIVEYHNSETGIVRCEGNRYAFYEGWLEPCEGLKRGDLAIFWDSDQAEARIGVYNQFYHGSTFPHEDHIGYLFKNAIKFESKEQYEKLIKGEL